MRGDIEMINSVAANWKSTQSCTERDEDYNKNAITLISGQHHEHRLRHERETIKIFSHLRGGEKASHLEPIGDVSDEEQDNAERQVWHRRDEATFGEIKV